MTPDTAAPPVAPVPPLGRAGPAGEGVAGLNRFVDDACDRTPGAVTLECGARRPTYAELGGPAGLGPPPVSHGGFHGVMSRR